MTASSVINEVLRSHGMDATDAAEIAFDILEKLDLDRVVREAKVEALESAEKAYNRESLGFQQGWGSNELDQAKLSVLGKTLTWLNDRAFKYRDPLPRYINLREDYKGLSDGAKIEVDSVIWSHRIGFGTFNADDGGVIQARSFNKIVKLVDHNL